MKDHGKSVSVLLKLASFHPLAVPHFSPPPIEECSQPPLPAASLATHGDGHLSEAHGRCRPRPCRSCGSPERSQGRGDPEETPVRETVYSMACAWSAYSFNYLCILDRAPFADDPPSGEGPFKRQRQWTHEEDDGRKMTVHATLATSNFPLREPQSEGFGLVRVPSGPGSAAANLFAPAVPPLVLLRDESRMAPVLSSLATSLIPSTETAPPKDRRANAKIQPESSSSTAGLNSNPYRVSADGEKNVPSMPMVLSTLRPNMGHQWPGVNVQGFGPRPPVPEAGIPRPTTRAAPPRYGGGISYGNAFVRSFGGEGPRFGQRATERTRPLRNVTAAAPNATGFVRLREPGYQERPRQPSTASFLPPNSNNSTDSSKLSAELVTTSTPFFLPSQVDPRIYAHQREQALAHLQQQAYAAAAMANLPQHFRLLFVHLKAFFIETVFLFGCRYDATFMPGYPTYLGIPLLGVHTNQIVEQALGRRAENYYEK